MRATVNGRLDNHLKGTPSAKVIELLMDVPLFTSSAGRS
jgi:hypothetical protein